MGERSGSGSKVVSARGEQCLHGVNALRYEKRHGWYSYLLPIFGARYTRPRTSRTMCQSTSVLIRAILEVEFEMDSHQRPGLPNARL